MKEMIPVHGHNNLFRDTSTGAIINKDKTNGGIARLARAKRKEDQDRLDTMEADISEIKDLLKQLLK